MVYIHKSLCKSIEEVSEILDQMDEMNEITVSTLLMIHYAYHHNDTDFDGGLKLIDKLHDKLTKYFDVCWDIENIKIIIRTSPDPGFDYKYLLSQLMTPEMIACFGV